jgi:hypothetical protein
MKLDLRSIYLSNDTTVNFVQKMFSVHIPCWMLVEFITGLGEEMFHA